MGLLVIGLQTSIYNQHQMGILMGFNYYNQISEVVFLLIESFQ